MSVTVKQTVTIEQADGSSVFMRIQDDKVRIWTGLMLAVSVTVPLADLRDALTECERIAEAAA